MAECLYCDERIERRSLESHELECAPLQKLPSFFHGEPPFAHRGIQHRKTPPPENFPQNTQNPFAHGDRSPQMDLAHLRSGYNSSENYWIDTTPQPRAGDLYLWFGAFCEVLLIQDGCVTMLGLKSPYCMEITLEEFVEAVQYGQMELIQA